MKKSGIYLDSFGDWSTDYIMLNKIYKYFTTEEKSGAIFEVVKKRRCR